MTNFAVGDRVRILPPFAADFLHEYVVVEVIVHVSLNQIAVVLDEIGAFDPIYLEKIE